VVTGPLQQVLEEVEQARVRPLHVLEDEHRRRLLGEPLEQDPPGREKVLLIAGHALLHTEQVREPRLDPGALLGIGNVLFDRGLQLGPRRSRFLIVDDLAAHTHHLGECPVGHALAVGETAAAVPPDVSGQAVDVLLELPGEAGLADASDPDHGDEVCLLLLRACVKELLDQAELALPADEGGLEALGFERAGAACRHPECAEEWDRLCLALEFMDAGVGVGDRGLARALGGLADQHRAGFGCGLDARGGVDEVAGDHPLALGAERNRGLAGEHPRAGTELWRADLVTER
jgi:hypothetical protein